MCRAGTRIVGGHCGPGLALGVCVGGGSARSLMAGFPGDRVPRQGVPVTIHLPQDDDWGQASIAAAIAALRAQSSCGDTRCCSAAMSCTERHPLNWAMMLSTLSAT